MEDIVLITPPAAEPVALADVKLQLGLGPVEDSDRLAQQQLSDKLRAFIAAAREACEDYTRRVFITQTWLLRRDSFPGHNFRYQTNGYPEIDMPKPPLQSIASFQYVDVSGTLQTLTQDTTYGVDPTFPQYGYQLDRGSETQPGRLISPFARPWPPTRMVPSNVIIQFRAGYGGPVTVSMTNGSAVLTAPNFTFNNDDQPLMAGDTGTLISIPGAGANGATLNTNVTSVANGVATLAATAGTTVTNVMAWVGKPVPKQIIAAIKFLVQDYYENGSAGGDLPESVTRQLKPYRNLVA
jgi:uncharacterized phiE125 gp8 family phage protein